MANFSIRPQLHNAAVPVYLALHEAFARVGIVRTIRGDDGVLYDLPWGEYRLDGVVATPEQVRDMCWGVLASVHPDYELVVTQEVYSAWKGLPRSQAA